jgi:hypothetical protein
MNVQQWFAAGTARAPEELHSIGRRPGSACSHGHRAKAEALDWELNQNGLQKDYSIRLRSIADVIQSDSRAVRAGTANDEVTLCDARYRA